MKDITLTISKSMFKWLQFDIETQRDSIGGTLEHLKEMDENLYDLYRYICKDEYTCEAKSEAARFRED